jgi:methyl-accepting chemotaxis protein
MKKWKTLSLVVRLSIFIGSLVLLVFILLTFMVSNQASSNVLEIQQQNMAQSVSQIRETVEITLDYAQDMVLINSQEQIIIDELKQEQFTYSRGILGKIMNTNDFYENIFMTNKNGTIVLSPDPKLQGRNIKEQPFWKNNPKDKVYTEPYVHPSPFGNYNAIVVTAPVMDANKNFLGLFCISLNMEEISKSYVLPRKFGTTGYAFILDQKAKMIAHPDENLILKDLSALDFIMTIVRSDKKTDFFPYDQSQL